MWHFSILSRVRDLLHFSVCVYQVFVAASFYCAVWIIVFIAWGIAMTSVSSYQSGSSFQGLHSPRLAVGQRPLTANEQTDLLFSAIVAVITKVVLAHMEQQKRDGVPQAGESGQTLSGKRVRHGGAPVLASDLAPTGLPRSTARTSEPSFDGFDRPPSGPLPRLSEFTRQSSITSPSASTARASEAASATPALPGLSKAQTETLNACDSKKALTAEVRKLLASPPTAELSPEGKRDLVAGLLNGSIKAKDQQAPYTWTDISEICGEALTYPAGQGHGNVFYIVGTRYAVKRNLPTPELGVYKELEFYDRAVQVWNKTSGNEGAKAAAVQQLLKAEEAEGSTVFVRKHLQEVPEYSGKYVCTYDMGDRKPISEDEFRKKVSKKEKVFRDAEEGVVKLNTDYEKISYLRDFLKNSNAEVAAEFERDLKSRFTLNSTAIKNALKALHKEARKAGIYRPQFPQPAAFVDMIKRLAEVRADGVAAYRSAKVYEPGNAEAFEPFVVMQNSLRDDEGNEINEYATQRDGQVYSHNLLDVKIGAAGASSGEQKYNAYAEDTAQMAGLGQKKANGGKKARVGWNHRTDEYQQAAVVGKKGVKLDGRMLSGSGKESAERTEYIIHRYAEKMTTEQLEYIVEKLDRIIKEAIILPFAPIGSSVVIALPKDSETMPGVMPIDYAHPVSAWDADDRLTSDVASSRTLPGALHPEKFDAIGENYLGGLNYIRKVFNDALSKAAHRPQMRMPLASGVSQFGRQDSMGRSPSFRLVPSSGVPSLSAQRSTSVRLLEGEDE